MCSRHNLHHTDHTWIYNYNIAFVNSERWLAKSRVDITLCQHGKFPATLLLKFFVLYYKRNIKHFPCWYTVMSTRVKIGKTRNCVETRRPQGGVFSHNFEFFQFSHNFEFFQSNNSLLVHKGWLFLWNVKSRFQLLTDIHRLKYYANSCTKVIQLSTHDICGLLIFKRQDDSQNALFPLFINKSRVWLFILLGDEFGDCVVNQCLGIP